MKGATVHPLEEIKEATEDEKKGVLDEVEDSARDAISAVHFIVSVLGFVFEAPPLLATTAVVGGLIVGTADVWFALMLRLALSDYFETRNEADGGQSLVLLISISGVLCGVYAVTLAFNDVVLGNLLAAIMHKVRLRVGMALLHQGDGYSERHTAMADDIGVLETAMRAVLLRLPQIFGVVGATATLATVAWDVALAFMLVVLIVFLGLSPVRSHTRKALLAQMTAHEYLVPVLTNALRGLDVTAATLAQSWALRRLEPLLKALDEARQKVLFWSAATLNWGYALSWLFMALAVSFVAVRVLEGETSSAEFAAIVYVVRTATQPTHDLADIYVRALIASPSLVSIKNLWTDAFRRANDKKAAEERQKRLRRHQIPSKKRKRERDDSNDDESGAVAQLLISPLSPGSPSKSGGSPGVAFDAPHHVEIDSVWAKYPMAAEETLQGLSLKVARGEQIALVGKSGSGKTSVLRLLMGAMAKRKGEVMIDGVPVQSMEHAAKKLHTAVVFQDSFLFSCSIAQNIALGRPGGMGAVRKAALLAGILGDVEKLPLGFETIVAESNASLAALTVQETAHGVSTMDDSRLHKVASLAANVETTDNTEETSSDAIRMAKEAKQRALDIARNTVVDLSRGQRQRICVARALYSNPQLLLLDEATSVLDPPSSKALMRMLDRVTRTRNITAIHITHDAHALEFMDRVVVLDGGRVAEEGRYTDLCANPDSYVARAIRDKNRSKWSAINAAALPQALSRVQSSGLALSPEAAAIAKRNFAQRLTKSFMPGRAPQVVPTVRVQSTTVLRSFISAGISSDEQGEGKHWYSMAGDWLRDARGSNEPGSRFFCSPADDTPSESHSNQDRAHNIAHTMAAVRKRVTTAPWWSFITELSAMLGQETPVWAIFPVLLVNGIKGIGELVISQFSVLILERAAAGRSGDSLLTPFIIYSLLYVVAVFVQDAWHSHVLSKAMARIGRQTLAGIFLLAPGEARAVAATLARDLFVVSTFAWDILLVWNQTVFYTIGVVALLAYTVPLLIGPYVVLAAAVFWLGKYLADGTARELQRRGRFDAAAIAVLREIDDAVDVLQASGATRWAERRLLRTSARLASATSSSDRAAAFAASLPTAIAWAIHAALVLYLMKDVINGNLSENTFVGLAVVFRFGASVPIFVARTFERSTRGVGPLGRLLLARDLGRTLLQWHKRTEEAEREDDARAADAAHDAHKNAAHDDEDDKDSFSEKDDEEDEDEEEDADEEKDELEEHGTDEGYLHRDLEEIFQQTTIKADDDAVQTLTEKDLDALQASVPVPPPIKAVSVEDKEVFSADEMHAHIVFRNVTARYTSSAASRPALTDLNLRIPKGAQVSITGGSGVGKSSIFRLLMGQLLPEKGTILLSGSYLADISQSSLMERLGVVHQNSFVFAGTVADNISLGRPGTLADVKRAARLAGLHKDIERFPAGYHSFVADEGVTSAAAAAEARQRHGYGSQGSILSEDEDNLDPEEATAANLAQGVFSVVDLSRGQKQRLCVARAIFARPKLLLLDDIAAGLDPPTAKSLFDTLHHVTKSKGITGLYITHNVDLLRRSDTILFLGPGGVIQEHGSFGALMQARGRFYRLIRRRLAGWSAVRVHSTIISSFLHRAVVTRRQASETPAKTDPQEE